MFHILVTNSYLLLSSSYITLNHLVLCYHNFFHIFSLIEPVSPWPRNSTFRRPWTPFLSLSIWTFLAPSSFWTAFLPLYFLLNLSHLSISEPLYCTSHETLSFLLHLNIFLTFFHSPSESLPSLSSKYLICCCRGEQNFHIFYYLHDGLEAEDKLLQYCLDKSKRDKHRYLAGANWSKSKSEVRGVRAGKRTECRGVEAKVGAGEDRWGELGQEREVRTGERSEGR